MSDKLLIEIDMFNGEIRDAVPALIFLANELVEAGLIEILQPINWNERVGNSYQVKWRFSEDELHLPFDINFIHQLSDELKTMTNNNIDQENTALGSFRRQLESCLAANKCDLFTECEI